jgi:Zn-dependent protease with chaperone function
MQPQPAWVLIGRGCLGLEHSISFELIFFGYGLMVPRKIDMNQPITTQWFTLIDSGKRHLSGGDFVRAEQAFRTALTELDNGSEPGQRAETLNRLALALEKQGRLQESHALLKESINLLEYEQGMEHPALPALLWRLVSLAHALSDWHLFREALKKAIPVFKQTLGTDHPHTKILLEQYEASAHSQENENRTVQDDPSNGFETKSNQGSEKTKAIRISRVTSSSTENQAIDEEEHVVPIAVPPYELSSYVLKKEKVYWIICLVFSVLAYLMIAVTLIILVPMVWVATVISHGLFVGHLRANSIRISEDQLPEIHRMVEEICAVYKMPVPTIYVSNGEGMLNAFATRILSRDFVVLYSNILELAYEKGEAEVAFVLAHELAHIKRGHTKWRFLILPSHLVPLLPQAYSRACESTCDRFASVVCPKGAKWGLVALAAGSRIYRRVNLQALYAQFASEHGFWSWFYEILSTHPNLVRRIATCGLSLPNPGLESEYRKVHHKPESLPKRRIPRSRV